MTYLQLFLSFIQIGLFSFGGGYAAIPLIQDQVVSIHGWLSMKEFTDLITISQMTPGPIAINAATYVGYTMGEFWGSTLATGMVCLAPFAIMLAVCMFFMSMKNHPRVAGAMALLRPAVVGLVLAALLTLLNGESFRDWKSVVIFAAAFAASVWLKLHPILLMFAAGIAGWLLY